MTMDMFVSAIAKISSIPNKLQEDMDLQIYGTLELVACPVHKVGFAYPSCATNDVDIPFFGIF
jgi:hypothetical protein